MDIQIFPHRILSADTTELVLNKIEALDDVHRTVINGPRLPPEDLDLPPQYREKRTINVQGKEIDLKVQTGRIFVEISQESTIDEVKNICQDAFPFGFEINIGKFMRTQKTVTDHMKYGDEKIPDEYIGMTDQSAKLSDRLTILKKDGN
ncbi:methyl-coenzyme M reductase operon protein D [Methanobrevibacter curvatus]|uniref:Methyl-coenzyme M reductase operon protein D n=1 Tax=Methanobrevibacter curvatus TaxID=49547 RepID=A0A166CF39_9EURY|nr:methyl-coenzyme M reductase operon protein D [Methanobrevibacter curvatus]KZX14434.1 methyl-coenzyme M reductase operon protein D [Methanobrevibacter curvatus]